MPGGGNETSPNDDPAPAPIDAMAALAAVPGKVLNPKLALPALTMCWWCRPVEPVCWPV